MNTKRKNRSNSNSARSPRARGTERNVALDGVYNNSYFMNSVTSLVGSIIKVHTSTGVIFEGIFRTFSAQFEVVVELAHKVDPSNPLQIHIDSVIEKIIFKAPDIIKLEIIDADIDYATRDTFQTDTAISKFNGQVTEKELEPWDCAGNNVDEYELDGTTSNGWDVNEMFRQNEQMYGVTSNFDHGLSDYTTPLQNKDSKDYKDAEAKAAKIANEIESNPNYKVRIDMENGEEEDKYAAVVRPSSSDSSPNSEGNKYVCPPKRKTVQSKTNVRTSSVPPVQVGNNNSIKSSSNSSFPQHHPPASQTVTPTSLTNNNSRERVNGISESPKPQRTTLTTRHARSFASSEPSRFNQTQNVTTQTTTPCNNVSTETSRSSVNHNHNHINYSTNNVISSSDHHHRKPPILQHPPEHQGSTSLNIPRKVSRGRDDQISELKKFQSDFKYNEGTEEKKPTANESEITNIQTISRTVETPTEATISRPSSGGNPESTDSKALKSKLNPNAKEFIYNPNAKPFTPRSASTPTQSRPHTPQTPGYGGPVPPLQAMVMPTYVVAAAQSPYAQQPNQANRYRKVHMGMSQPSQMQVAAATGQPLLAPAPMHTQFTVPYSPQAHIAPQPYQQMVRMVAQQSGGMVPPVLTAINYPPEGTQTQMQFMGPGSIGPHPHHPPHVHPSQNTSSSPQANSGQLGNASSTSGGSNASGGGVSNSSAGPPPPSYPPSPANSYSQPPPAGPGAPHPPNPPHHTYPILCPMIPAPPPPPHPAPHTPHHMIAAAAAQSTVQTYIHHHHPHQHSAAVGNQQHHIQVILPHSQ
ncbi:unnamed protein product [Nezara viridula]|uniref:LsmAD domain-containing protein n=1 Tax=Nezara viridula TaxID=85310 RepID=A0A9P0E7Q5_NEZVI|nr:unnamed protein product [Nezara viridula]